jgi:hypothetical protein
MRDAEAPKDDGSDATRPEDLDVPDATPATPVVAASAAYGPADLTEFCRLDELGLEVAGQRLEAGRATLACRVVPDPDSDERWCRDCGCEGTVRDTVVRRLAHEPFGSEEPSNAVRNRGAQRNLRCHG